MEDVDVPELATGLDREAADRWREQRGAERSVLAAQDLPIALALATDGRSHGTGAQLTAAGADLAGLLAPEPLESLAWAAAAGARRAYPDLPALLADEVEAVCVDLDAPGAGAIARTAVTAGLHVLLTRPASEDAGGLRRLVEAAQQEDVAVTCALASRTWRSVPPALDMVRPLGVLRQVTVVGWPIGRLPRLELVDLVRRICGDILAVCAAPRGMPAGDLRPGQPVTLALLTESGATVLAAESPTNHSNTSHAPTDAGIENASVTVVGSDGRLVLGSDFLRRQDARGVAAASLPPESSADSPLAVALTGLDGADPTGRSREPATLGDLLAASRVLELAASSYEVGGWLET